MAQYGRRGRGRRAFDLAFRGFSFCRINRMLFVYGLRGTRGRTHVRRRLGVDTWDQENRDEWLRDWYEMWIAFSKKHESFK